MFGFGKKKNEEKLLPPPPPPVRENQGSGESRKDLTPKASSKPPAKKTKKAVTLKKKKPAIRKHSQLPKTVKKEDTHSGGINELAEKVQDIEDIHLINRLEIIDEFEEIRKIVSSLGKMEKRLGSLEESVKSSSEGRGFSIKRSSGDQKKLDEAMKKLRELDSKFQDLSKGISSDMRSHRTKVDRVANELDEIEDLKATIHKLTNRVNELENFKNDIPKTKELKKLRDSLSEENKNLEKEFGKLNEKLKSKEVREILKTGEEIKSLKEDFSREVDANREEISKLRENTLQELDKEREKLDSDLQQAVYDLVEKAVDIELEGVVENIKSISRRMDNELKDKHDESKVNELQKSIDKSSEEFESLKKIIKDRVILLEEMEIDQIDAKIREMKDYVDYVVNEAVEKLRRKVLPAKSEDAEELEQRLTAMEKTQAELKSSLEQFSDITDEKLTNTGRKSWQSLRHVKGVTESLEARVQALEEENEDLRAAIDEPPELTSGSSGEGIDEKILELKKENLLLKKDLDDLKDAYFELKKFREEGPVVIE